MEKDLLFLFLSDGTKEKESFYFGIKGITQLSQASFLITVTSFDTYLVIVILHVTLALSKKKTCLKVVGQK